jgi:hypothetical protein
MKKSVLLSAALLSFSSIGLISALITDYRQQDLDLVPDTAMAPAVSSPVTEEAAPKSEPDNVPNKPIHKTSKRFRALLRFFPVVSLPYAFTEAQVKDGLLHKPKRLEWDVVEFRDEEIEEEEAAPLNLPELIEENAETKDETKTEITTAIKIAPPPTLSTPKTAKQDNTRSEGKVNRERSELIEAFVNNNVLRYFSRFPSHFIPVARMETDDFHILVYEVIEGSQNAYRNYGVATFDQSGRRIANQLVGKIYPEEAMTFTINHNLMATCHFYKVIWAKDYAKFGNQQNQVENLKFEKTRYLDLTRFKKGNPDIRSIQRFDPPKADDILDSISKPDLMDPGL